MVESVDRLKEEDYEISEDGGGDDFVDDMLTVGTLVYGATSPIILGEDLKENDEAFHANLKNIVASETNKEAVLLYPMNGYTFDGVAWGDIIDIYDDYTREHPPGDYLVNLNSIFRGTERDGYKALNYMKGQYWSELTSSQKNIFTTFISGSGRFISYRNKAFYGTALDDVLEMAWVYDPTNYIE